MDELVFYCIMQTIDQLSCFLDEDIPYLLEYIGGKSEFPKSSDKKTTNFSLNHYAYFGSESRTFEDIVGSP